MEPNTSSSPTTWTSPAAVLEHGEPSVRDPSLESSAFSHAASPSLVPASGSRSGVVGNRSLSVDVRMMSSQSLPSSFPLGGTLPMVSYDLFGNPKATAVTSLPMLFEGQWEQGEPSIVLPECPRLGLLRFAGESTVWPRVEMASIFSPSYVDSLAPQSSDNLTGFALPSSDSELEPLRQSLCIRSLEVDESPVDTLAPLPPFEKEEEIDVSAFLVSDPEDELPKASSMTSLQMADSGGGVSASWMLPASTGNKRTPLRALTLASTCTMLSTSSGSMPCRSGGSSIGVASSIGVMKKPSSPVLPVVPPSSQGSCAASSSNFSGFVQPSSSFFLTPFAPDLNGLLLPVKQEVMEYAVDARAHHHHPDFISLVDDEDGLYQDGIPFPSSIPDPKFYWPMPETSSSWGSLMLGSSRGFATRSGGDGSPGFAPGSWGSSSSLSFAGRTMPCFDRRTSIDIYGSSSLSMLSIGGKMPSTGGLPPLPRAGASSSKRGAEVIFTDHEMAVIRKQKSLQELLRTNPKKVKRILYNRAYSAMAKARKATHTKDLERLIVTLETERKSLSAELQSLEERSAMLWAKQMEMQMLFTEHERQMVIKDAVREGLRAEIQKLKHLKLN